MPVHQKLKYAKIYLFYQNWVVSASEVGIGEFFLNAKQSVVWRKVYFGSEDLWKPSKMRSEFQRFHRVISSDVRLWNASRKWSVWLNASIKYQCHSMSVDEIAGSLSLWTLHLVLTYYMIHIGLVYLLYIICSWTCITSHLKEEGRM